MALFRNRSEAGQLLARKLWRYAKDEHVVVLGLPRGGVPVAFEVARTLGAPLDVFVVRKLGVPGHRELAMGAIASGGVAVFNDSVVQNLHIPQSAIDTAIAEESAELRRRERRYRDNRPFPVIADRVVILVDDGLATGATMKAAVQAIRQLAPQQVIVAVPVSSVEAVQDLAQVADEVVCVQTPDPFWGVGAWYQDFTQTTDEEVCALLETPASPSAPLHSPGESL